MPKGEAMKIILALIVLALCASGGVSQEHAPTVGMCRADVAVWYGTEMSTEYYRAENALLSDGVANPTEAAKLPITEATARFYEMADCQSVDAQRRNNYFNARVFYLNIVADRYFRYVLRHHLKDQLLREDAQGIR